uniref:Uncharacterized protein n=1 Tax=Tanacetum cinerariifolium TaxID=118510 RepID=A0A699J5N6_TANCI|nr:hypothetical protein [Tanacetum cinerariifolium]
MRIDPTKTQKEPTYQVVADALALTTRYLAFLITADVSEIYMQQFWMTNRQMRESTSYKTYLAYVTGEASPKMKRKFKKPASPLKKRTLVTIKEEEPEPAKKVKKAPAKAERSKGIELLSNAALLDEAQLKKALKRSKQDTNIHQAGGSSNSNDEENKQDESDDDHEKADDERTKSGNPRTSDDEEEIRDDEYVHTPEDYVPTDGETNDKSNDVDEEEYDGIDKELYSDVNVRLIDAEPDDKDKGDKEMTKAKIVETEQKNVNQEGASNQVKDDDHATQKTEVPIQSSSIFFDYAAKFLNFDNIPPVETEVVSMLDIDVQHEAPRTSPLLTIVVSVKMLKEVDHKSKILTAYKFEVPTIVKEHLGTSLDDSIHKVIQRHTVERIKEHSILADAVNALKQQQNLQKSAEEIQKIKMEQVEKLPESKYTIRSSDKTALIEFDMKKALFDSMHASKSFNKYPTNKTLYHALIESLIKDENDMDQGETMFEVGDTQRPHNQEQDMGNTDDQPNVEATPKHDWFKKPERPSTPDLDWNVRKSVDFRPPQT